MRRYNHLIYIPNELPIFGESSEIQTCEIQGSDLSMFCVKNDITEEETRLNKSVCDKCEATHSLIVELFEIDNLWLTVASNYISFNLETWGDGYNHAGYESPLLDRNKLRELSTQELTGALIDLVLDRHQWITKQTYGYVVG